MATYRAIGVLGDTLIGILRDTIPLSEFQGATVEMFQAANFRTPLEEGISLYLFRAVPTASRRNLPPRKAPDGRTLRPSLPFDLHYLITPWGRSAGQQHRLLGWALRTLEDHSPLGPSLLNHYAPETDTFGPDETHDLMFDTISIQDMSSIWELGKPAVQLSVTMIIRQVTLDSVRPLPDTVPVQVRDVGLKPSVEATS